MRAALALHVKDRRLQPSTFPLLHVAVFAKQGYEKERTALIHNAWGSVAPAPSNNLVKNA